MNAEPTATQTTRIASLERHEFVTSQPFDTVLQRVHQGLGHPDFAVLQRQLVASTSWQDFRALTDAAAGSSGLMVFLELNVGDTVARDPDAPRLFKAHRIIAGNPSTMESMARTVPEAAAFAPVTLLIVEGLDGVHLRYDTITSALGDEMTPDARLVAENLDREVLALLGVASQGY